VLPPCRQFLQEVPIFQKFLDHGTDDEGILCFHIVSGHFPLGHQRRHRIPSSGTSSVPDKARSETLSMYFTGLLHRRLRSCSGVLSEAFFRSLLGLSYSVEGIMKLL